MMRTRVPGRLIAGALLAALAFSAPDARPDDAPPPDGGGQSPRDQGTEGLMPEKSLMPEVDETVDHDLDGPFAFEYLCRMSGDWESEGGAIVASFRTTAGGSAVFETLFPGSSGEMTAVYHLDDGDLVSTVYAPGGHQLRLKFDRRRSFFGKYWFHLAGGAGFDKSKNRHLHEKSLQFTGLNRIDMELIFHAGKDRLDTVIVPLTRKQQP